MSASWAPSRKPRRHGLRVELLRLRLGDKASKWSTRGTSCIVASYSRRRKVVVLVEVAQHRLRARNGTSAPSPATPRPAHRRLSDHQYLSSRTSRRMPGRRAAGCSSRGGDNPRRARQTRWQAAQVMEEACCSPAAFIRTSTRATSSGCAPSCRHDGRERRHQTLRPLPGRGVTDKPAFQRSSELSVEALMVDSSRTDAATSRRSPSKQGRSDRGRGPVVWSWHIYRCLRGAAPEYRATADYNGRCCDRPQRMTLQRRSREGRRLHARYFVAHIPGRRAVSAARAMRQSRRAGSSSRVRPQPVLTRHSRRSARLEISGDHPDAKTGVEGSPADPKKRPDASSPSRGARCDLARLR